MSERGVYLFLGTLLFGTICFLLYIRYEEGKRRVTEERSTVFLKGALLLVKDPITLLAILEQYWVSSASFMNRADYLPQSLYGHIALVCSCLIKETKEGDVEIVLARLREIAILPCYNQGPNGRSCERLARLLEDTTERLARRFPLIGRAEIKKDETVLHGQELATVHH